MAQQTKQRTALQIGNCKVIEFTYTNGPFIGDYFYKVFKDGHFEKEFGNREGNAAFDLCKQLATIKTKPAN